MNFKSSKQIQKINTQQRLRKIHEWYLSNPGAAWERAITEIPETAYMVCKYHRMLEELYRAKISAERIQTSIEY